MNFDEDYNGKTLLKDWWGKVKNNFSYLKQKLEQEISDRDNAITAAIEAEETARNSAISEAAAEEASQREAADTELAQTKVDKIDGYGLACVGGKGQGSNTGAISNKSWTVLHFSHENNGEIKYTEVTIPAYVSDLKDFSDYAKTSAIDELKTDKADKQTANGGFIGGSEAISYSGGAVGSEANTNDGGAIGSKAYSYSGGAAGSNATAGNGGAIGKNAKASGGFAGGENAQTVSGDNISIDAIQLGTGTNPNEYTMQIYDYQLLADDAVDKSATDGGKYLKDVGILTDLNTADTTDIVSAVNSLVSALDEKQDILTFDSESKLNSDNPITSGGVYDELELIRHGISDNMNTIGNEIGAIQSSLDDKVDKVDGKGLSANDYTDEEKAKLAGLENYTLPDDVVHDASYVHTDNNYTTDEKSKLAELSNYDDTDIKSDIAKKADKLKSIPHTTVSGNPIEITDALADEQPLEMRVHGCKNLFDENLLLEKDTVTKTDNGYLITQYPVIFNSNMNLTKNFKSIVKPNTIYTMSRNAEFEPVGNSIGAITIRTKDETTGATADVRLVGPGTGEKSNTFSLSKYQIDNISYIMLYGGASPNEVTFSNIQLEEGETATEYEPCTVIGDLNGEKYEIPISLNNEQTVTAILDTPLSAGEYIDFVSKRRNGETDITVNGDITLFDRTNDITCQTEVSPSKLEVSYYRDINKVIEELKNAILSQGGNV